MKIRLLGQRNFLGGGVLFSNLVDALRKMYFPESIVEEVDLFDDSQFASIAASSSKQDINIWTWPDERVEHVQGVHIVWAMFESDRLPPHYTRFLHADVDVVWVPSHWGRDVLVANGVNADCIDIVPLGVDGSTFHPYLRPKRSQSQPFRFLAVGKFETRKAYQELLAGFMHAFPRRDDVQLVVKADHFLDHENKRKALAELVASLGLSNVKILEGSWVKEQLLGLYSTCDVFIFPSRAEGWGLPAIEAIATGLPIVSTYYSAHKDFLQFAETSLIKISTTLVPIDDPEYQSHWPCDGGDFGRWAQPSIPSIAEGLNTAWQRHAELSDAAMENSLIIRERFSWGAAAGKALSHLKRRGLIPLAFRFPE